MNTVLSIAVLAAFALLLGAFALWRRGGHTKQALLMVILAAVAVANVAIWLVPDAEGTVPLDQIEQIENNQP